MVWRFNREINFSSWNCIINQNMKNDIVSKLPSPSLSTLSILYIPVFTSPSSLTQSILSLLYHLHRNNSSGTLSQGFSLGNRDTLFLVLLACLLSILLPEVYNQFLHSYLHTSTNEHTLFDFIQQHSHVHTHTHSVGYFVSATVHCWEAVGDEIMSSYFGDSMLPRQHFHNKWACTKTHAPDTTYWISGIQVLNPTANYVAFFFALNHPAAQ